MTATVELAFAARAAVGEGAVWDVADGGLWWTDIARHVVHCYDPASGRNESHDFGEPVGSLSRRDAGGLVLAARSGFYLYDPETGMRTSLGDPESDRPGNRFNDGATDDRGRFWAGTMRLGGGGEAPCGRFYRLDPDGRITRHFDPAFTTNGMTFSPDGRTLYRSDSDPRVRLIWASDYDPDTGTASNERVFFDTREVAGRPDGGTVDADGCYWMAGVGGWQLVRITPAGKVDCIVEMPVEKPTKPMFGGPGLDTLFVTSIGLGLDDDPRQPHAGGLFAVSGLGMTGIPQSRYGG